MFKQLPPQTAIKKRLTIYLGIGVTTAWLLANIMSLGISLHELNETADSKMTELARALPFTALQQTVLLPEVEEFLGSKAGDAASRHGGMAVWNITGKLLLADEEGEQIPLKRISGFVNSGPIWKKSSRRILYLYNPESGQTVAVSQRWRERLDAVFGVVWVQLSMSILVLPLMIFLLRLAVNRSIQPLNNLVGELRSRQADNLSPINLPVPKETQPVVDSVNYLFERVRNAIAREQRFTADAAHELRSPLAALKVQTEVLAMSDTDEQPYHIHQIQQSITRAEHLVSQLLTLAKIDPTHGLENKQSIDWLILSNQVLNYINLAAREKRIQLKRNSYADHPLPLQGNAELILLMLRNLLDNAVRYSPSNSQVELNLYADKIEIRDQGAGIADEHMSKIKERFYRPAGQNEQGSGLGLSIVEQVAVLHGLSVVFENRVEGGLSVWLVKNDILEE